MAQETEIFYEVEGKWVVLGDVQVDIGANASAGVWQASGRWRLCSPDLASTGAPAWPARFLWPALTLLLMCLPSPLLRVAEEPEEELESSSKRVVDLVDAFRLNETSWDKKGFMGYIKGYMKAVADKLPEERKEKFMAEAPAAVKELLGRFSELQFFTGESMDLEGSMAYAYYKEGSSEPTFLFFKDGLKEVRCLCVGACAALRLTPGCCRSSAERMGWHGCRVACVTWHYTRQSNPPNDVHFICAVALRAPRLRHGRRHPPLEGQAAGVGNHGAVVDAVTLVGGVQHCAAL